MQSPQTTEHRGPGRPKKLTPAKRIRGIIKHIEPTWLPAVKPVFQAPPTRPSWMTPPVRPAKTCQYVLRSDGRTPLFCDKPVQRGSWCEACASLVFITEQGADHHA